ncbi:Endocuticle structural glycoprotein SgAbd-2 [Harpegnathos saltator]|uniref:Endocuticle structural glycoprotein SgAbd-2 n=1 Tax=Harpegnathos saltator TaxID=610380 RepID=E2BM13_HARSA|nr:Endocuticle structural glycoprotein SgAbd-2 [Harpegnathos saltator]
MPSARAVSHWRVGGRRSSAGSVYKHAGYDLDPHRPIIIVGLAIHTRVPPQCDEQHRWDSRPSIDERTGRASEMRPLVIALLTIVGTCYAARLDSTYLPPGSAGSAGGTGLIPPAGRGPPGGPGRHGGPGGHHGGPSAPGGTYGVPPSGPGGHGGFGPGGGGGGGSYPGGGAGGARGGGPGQEIPIISYSNENAGDGNYQFSYETGNGISVQETGHQQGESESVSGSFSYTGPDGMQYSITYTADEQGFHPQGAHLPTPPPIPPEIQRGVELALAAEARGENQDGGYTHEGGGYPSGGGGRGGHGGGGVYQGPSSYQASSAGGGYRY